MYPSSSSSTVGNSGNESTMTDYDSLRHKYEVHAQHHISLPKHYIPKDATYARRIMSGVTYPIALRLRGSVIPRIFMPVLLYGIWAMGLAIARDWLDETHSVTFGFSSQTIFALSLVIGMILGFRTNTAYERFREGRQVICDITVNLRNLKRIFSRTDFFSGGKRESIHALRLLPCFFIAVKRRLREEVAGGEHDDFEGILHDIERNVTNDLRRVPSVIIDRLFDFAANQTGLNSTPAMGHVAALSAAFTNLEKIMNTPIPSAYDIHLNQVIGLYLIIFPLQISDYWWAVPSTVFAAFTLLGVEGIGEEIENPFGYDWNDLPLDSYVAEFVEELQYAIDCVSTNQRAGMATLLKGKTFNDSGETTVLVDIAK